jgi:iron complex outermembrane receptor protein
MIRKNLLLRRALCAAGAVTLGTLGQTALAQTPPSQPPAQRVEKIEVTGSNIKRIDAESVAPVAVITREEIERSGKPTISEVLRDIPQNGGASFNETFTNSFSPGAAGISLRGLGQKSTLVLINGRRMSGYGFAQNIFDTYVDLNAIPASAVERIEVLKDGASAVYGSDAIAGVVNVILRRDYRGLEIGGSAGTSHEGGLDEQRANFGVGFGDLGKNRFNILATLDYYKRDQLLSSERSLVKDQDFRNEIGGLLAYATRAAYLSPNATTRQPFDPCTAPGVLVPANQLSGALTGTTCAYNPAAYLPIFPQTERIGALARGTVEFSSQLQGFFELSYSDNETFQTFTPGQVGTSNLTFNPANGGVRVIPGTLPVGHPSNPYAVATPFIYTFFEVGPRDSRIESKAWRGLGGLKGSWGNWDWEGAFGKAKTETDQFNYNNLRTSVLQRALAGGYDFRNQTGTNVTADQLRIDFLRAGVSELDFADFKVSSEVAQLPAGPLAMAAGYEWRNESLQDIPDAALAAGEVFGRGFTRVNGERRSTAAFLEFSVPVTKTIEAQIAARRDSYSDFGSAVSPKIGAKWSVTRDFLLRGSVGRGFRAPTLPEAAESNAISFITIRDPNFNNATFSTGRLSVSNPDLKPEKSKSYNLGFVFEPVKDFSIAIDYYKIRQNQLIGRDNPQTIINLAAAGDPFWTPFVIRDPATGFIVYVRNPVRNREFVQTAGYDLELRKVFSAGDWGKFTLATAWNWLLEISTPGAPGGPGINVADSNGLTGPNPRYRGNATFGWDRGPWSTTVTYRYVHSYDQTAATGQGRVGHYKDVDLYFAYRGFRNLKLFATVRNLMDTDRPWDSSAGTNGLDFQTHDMRGRYFTGGFTYQFK